MTFFLSKYKCPTKFKRLLKRWKKSPLNYLDVGCGNHMPTLTKHWFPQVSYYGIDREVYNNNEADLLPMKMFYKCDLESDNLEAIPDNFFDVIMCSHVVEHLTDAHTLLKRLSPKLKSGGEIYLEFPSVRSLSLWSARGTLNFCDDGTHVRVYTIPELVNTLLANNMKIIRAGKARDWLRVVFFFFSWPFQIYSLWKHGQIHSRYFLWDVTGFADYIHAVKR